MSPESAEHQYWEDRSETFDEDTSFIVGAELNEDIKAWLRNQLADTDEDAPGAST